MSRSPLTRLLITLGLVAVYAAFDWIPVPGIDWAAYAALPRATDAPPGPRLPLWLSWTPWMSAFLVVELLSFVIPPLRALRRAGAGGRRSLTRLALAAGVVFATVQAISVSRLLAGIVTPGGLPVVPSASGGALVAASLVGQTLACFLLARWISIYGLGNGFVALVVADTLVPLAAEIAGAADRSQYDVGLFASGLLVAILVAYLSREGAVPIVPTGEGPRELPFPPLASGVLALNAATALYLFWQPPVSGAAVIAVLVAMVCGFGGAAAWVFCSRRSVSRALTPMASLAPEATATGLVVRHLAVLALLVAVAPAIELWSDPQRLMWLAPAALTTLAAAAVDGVAEWRFRAVHGAAVPLQDFDNVHFAAYLRAAAIEAERPMLIQAYCFRRLYFFLGPVFKMTVWVPEDDAEAARAWLAGLAIETT